jgi:hypothetical protein
MKYQPRETLSPRRTGRGDACTLMPLITEVKCLRFGPSSSPAGCRLAEFQAAPAGKLGPIEFQTARWPHLRGEEFTNS